MCDIFKNQQYDTFLFYSIEYQNEIKNLIYILVPGIDCVI